MIEKRASLCQRPIHSRLAPSLRIKNFGWREPQNAESPSVGIVNSCSLICYVPDQFIVQSTKSLYLAPRILKERTQWEGCSVEDYLKNSVQRIMLLAKMDELELLQNYTVNSNLELTRTKVDSSWISFTHLLCNCTLPVTRTLDNCNLSLTRSNFCFPSDHFYIILPWIIRTMF